MLRMRVSREHHCEEAVRPEEARFLRRLEGFPKSLIEPFETAQKARLLRANGFLTLNNITLAINSRYRYSQLNKSKGDNMNRNRMLFSSLFIIFSLFPIINFSWNATGHKVIAKIAYDHLNPDARNTVDSLVHDMNQQYPYIKNFSDLAVWPDLIRRQKIETYAHWHYIDIPFSTDGTRLKNVMTTDNALWAVNKMLPIVKNKKANRYERSRFLAFYSHIVSDLHQPLHTVTYVSEEMKNGDRGGNAYHVVYRNKKDNLHHIWDNGVGVFEISDTNENIEHLANQLAAQYSEDSFGEKINQLKPSDWTTEGMLNAKRYVYATPIGEVVSDDYIQKGKSIAEQQAVIAGYRLAKLLNQLLGS